MRRLSAELSSSSDTLRMWVEGDYCAWHVGDAGYVLSRLSSSVIATQDAPESVFMQAGRVSGLISA